MSRYIEVFKPDGKKVAEKDLAIKKALSGQTIIDQELILKRTDTGHRWYGSCLCEKEGGQCVYPESRQDCIYPPGYWYWAYVPGDVTDSTSVTVTVTEQPPSTYPLTLVANPERSGMAEGAGDYEEGAQVNISAEANSGWQFVNWTDSDDAVVSTEASFTYTMPA